MTVQKTYLIVGNHFAYGTGPHDAPYLRDGEVVTEVGPREIYPGNGLLYTYIEQSHGAIQLVQVAHLIPLSSPVEAIRHATNAAGGSD
jgi:hypothetical protein